MRKRCACAAIVVLPLALLARADESARVVVVDDLAFGAAPAGLRVGDVVEWRNIDAFRHTATATGGGFDIDLPPGATGKITLTRAGVIHYICRFHPGMTGELRVAP
jgi:plastocyanin